MFNIKKIEIKNNILLITDRNSKTYGTILTNSKIANLLSQASNRSGSINKNIRYMNKYFNIALVCGFLCLIGAISPVIMGEYYAEVFLLMFGGLGVASFSLAAASKIYTKWLKKYAINNEYWEEIYDLLSTNQQVRNTNSYAKSNNLTNTINNARSAVDTNECTYSYCKKDIIQDYSSKDKVKVYKK